MKLTDYGYALRVRDHDINIDTFHSLPKTEREFNDLLTPYSFWSLGINYHGLTFGKVIYSINLGCLDTAYESMLSELKKHRSTRI